MNHFLRAAREVLGTDDFTLVNGGEKVLLGDKEVSKTQLNSIQSRAAELNAPANEDYRRAVQGHLDQYARDKGYDDGQTLASYAASTIPEWAAEAARFIAWRDVVWQSTYAELTKMDQKKRNRPPVESFLAELPGAV